MKLKILISIIVLGLIGLLTYKMLSLGQVQCGLCVEFNGKRQCTKAYGPNRSAALEEAHRNACATLTSGVTEVLACNRSPDLKVECQGSIK